MDNAYYSKKQIIATVDKKGNTLGKIDKWHAHKNGILHRGYLGILIYKNNLHYFKQDHMQRAPMKLPQKDTPRSLFITWHQDYVNRNTHIWSSRWDLRSYVQFIRYKKSRLHSFIAKIVGF